MWCCSIERGRRSPHIWHRSVIGLNLVIFEGFLKRGACESRHTFLVLCCCDPECLFYIFGHVKLHRVGFFSHTIHLFLSSKVLVFHCCWNVRSGLVIADQSATEPPNHLSTTVTMYHMHPVFSTGCKNPAHRHTVFTSGLFSSGDTRPRAFSFSPYWCRCRSRDAVMHHSLFSLYFSFSHTPHESHRYIRDATPRSGAGLSTSGLFGHRPRHHTLSWHKLRLLYGCVHTSARRIFVQLKRQHPRHAGRNPYRDMWYMGCSRYIIVA